MNENQISLEVKNIEFSRKIASNIELIRKMQNQSLAWMFYVVTFCSSIYTISVTINDMKCMTYASQGE